MTAFLGDVTGGPARLRALLARREPLLAPGVSDGLGARLVAQAGFDAAYMTGFGTAATRLGRPDVGLLTMTEMVDTARNVVRSCALPVIADADTGYGNAINVVRTVQEFEQAGVAAIHLEDQVSPKRCGHLDGKQVIPADEMAAKIRAAVAARHSDEFVLIARTDAAAVDGMDAAIERARRYRDEGADTLFVEAATTESEIERIASVFADVPLVFNWVEGGKTPPVRLDRLRELGFALVIFPITTLLAATNAMRAALAQIKAGGVPAPEHDQFVFGDFVDLIGLAEIQELDGRLSPS
jgi:2-methylisocitrate lyase-like PEP mutase family enzyme